MIIGECPYCDSPMVNELPDEELPIFEKLICKSCKETVWMKYSRVDSWAYTVDGFNEEYIIDENNKEIIKKG